METKICSKCKQEKGLNSYCSNRSECKQCHNLYNKIKYDKNIAFNRRRARDQAREKKSQRIEYRRIRSKTLEGRYVNWKANAKKRGIEFNITIQDLTNMPLICYYTGMELTLEKHNPNTVSLDRLDSSKGYEVGNIVFCCTMINWMKQEYSVKDFVDMCVKVSDNKNKLLDNSNNPCYI